MSEPEPAEMVLPVAPVRTLTAPAPALMESACVVYSTKTSLPEAPPITL